MDPLSPDMQNLLILVGQQGVAIANAIRLGVSPNELDATLSYGVSGEVSRQITAFAVAEEIKLQENKQER